MDWFRKLFLRFYMQPLAVPNIPNVTDKRQQNTKCNHKIQRQSWNNGWNGFVNSIQKNISLCGCDISVAGYCVNSWFQLKFPHIHRTTNKYEITDRYHTSLDECTTILRQYRGNNSIYYCRTVNQEYLQHIFIDCWIYCKHYRYNTSNALNCDMSTVWTVHSTALAAVYTDCNRTLTNKTTIFTIWVPG